MLEDFASAAARHLRDAESLQQHDAWDNAAYLAGYVAECSVKAVIELSRKAPRIHLSALSPLLVRLAADLAGAARRYRVDLDPDLDAIRDSWQTDLRYSRTGSVDEAQSKKMVAQAKRVFERTIGAMVLDGLYSRVPR
jgi:HEPN domain-containing protein